MYDNPSWFFVLASVIAAIGISMVFKNTISVILTELDRGLDTNTTALLNQQRTSFFIKIAMVEILPMILLACGILFTSDMPELLPLSAVFVPILLIVAALAVAAANLWSSMQAVIAHERVQNLGLRPHIQTIALIAVAFAASLPFLSIVVILTMLIA